MSRNKLRKARPMSPVYSILSSSSHAPLLSQRSSSNPATTSSPRKLTKPRPSHPPSSYTFLSDSDVENAREQILARIQPSHVLPVSRSEPASPIVTQLKRRTTISFSFRRSKPKPRNDTHQAFVAEPPRGAVSELGHGYAPFHQLTEPLPPPNWPPRLPTSSPLLPSFTSTPPDNYLLERRVRPLPPLPVSSPDPPPSLPSHPSDTPGDTTLYLVSPISQASQSLDHRDAQPIPANIQRATSCRAVSHPLPYSYSYPIIYSHSDDHSHWSSGELGYSSRRHQDDANQELFTESEGYHESDVDMDLDLDLELGSGSEKEDSVEDTHISTQDRETRYTFTLGGDDDDATGSFDVHSSPSSPVLLTFADARIHRPTSEPVPVTAPADTGSGPDANVSLDDSSPSSSQGSAVACTSVSTSHPTSPEEGQVKLDTDTVSNTDASPHPCLSRPKLACQDAGFLLTHQQRRRRWTLGMALVDEDITDEVLVKELERLWAGKHRTLDRKDSLRRRSDQVAPPSVASSRAKSHVVTRSRALLVVRELIRTERSYLASMRALLAGKVAGASALSVPSEYDADVRGGERGGRGVMSDDGHGASKSLHDVFLRPSSRDDGAVGSPGHARMSAFGIPFLLPSKPASTPTSASASLSPPKRISTIANLASITRGQREEPLSYSDRYWNTYYTRAGHSRELAGPGAVPRLMLAYVDELVRVSEGLLGKMERDPSIRGVARAFLEMCEGEGASENRGQAGDSAGAAPGGGGELEAAFVAWCGVVGEWFVDRRGSGRGGERQGKLSKGRTRTQSQSGGKRKERLSVEQQSDGDPTGKWKVEGGAGNGAITAGVAANGGGGVVSKVTSRVASSSPLRKTMDVWRKSVPSIAILSLTSSPSEFGSEESEGRRHRHRHSTDEFPTSEATASKHELGPDGKKLPSVRDLAILPTQRVTRYVLLFRDLLAHTPPSSPSRPVVEHAVEVARHVAQKCDRAQGNAAFLRRR